MTEQRSDEAAEWKAAAKDAALTLATALEAVAERDRNLTEIGMVLPQLAERIEAIKVERDAAVAERDLLRRTLNERMEGARAEIADLRAEVRSTRAVVHELCREAEIATAAQPGDAIYRAKVLASDLRAALAAAAGQPCKIHGRYNFVGDFSAGGTQ